MVTIFTFLIPTVDNTNMAAVRTCKLGVIVFLWVLFHLSDVPRMLSCCVDKMNLGVFQQIEPVRSPYANFRLM